ncbi:hypothetical protein HL653_22130 [Sphingomonas sp. AP4-R1]|uniref:hypothetical protein n=1 Tax=Sphingomonas sp. AP4-R1 TaxID=2735134 RepID=UPI0014936DAA|nr:hypothetical protein [Sphingomonas sp. AP4-R1]QJU60073.1 hypothetical protein HL653_22130 [Sphingomonas sp. AP4-R1]
MYSTINQASAARAFEDWWASAAVHLYRLNERPESHVRAPNRPFRFPEEFRAPAGVRKSWKHEPAGCRRCAMGFSVLALPQGWGDTAGMGVSANADRLNLGGERYSQMAVAGFHGLFRQP